MTEAKSLPYDFDVKTLDKIIRKVASAPKVRKEIYNEIPSSKSMIANTIKLLRRLGFVLESGGKISATDLGLEYLTEQKPILAKAVYDYTPYRTLFVLLEDKERLSVEEGMNYTVSKVMPTMGIEKLNEPIQNKFVRGFFNITKFLGFGVYKQNTCEITDTGRNFIKNAERGSFYSEPREDDEELMEYPTHRQQRFVSKDLIVVVQGKRHDFDMTNNLDKLIFESLSKAVLGAWLTVDRSTKGESAEDETGNESE